MLYNQEKRCIENSIFMTMSKVLSGKVLSLFLVVLSFGFITFTTTAEYTKLECTYGYVVIVSFGATPPIDPPE